jgi:hypothetical protein
MVPTFCAIEPKPNCGPVDTALGSARAGDGDLPLAEGEGGGEPKRESSSCGTSSYSACIVFSTGADGIMNWIERDERLSENSWGNSQT